MIKRPSELEVRLTRFVMVLLAITGLGTIGYVLLEGWTLVDALYMTVITLSTVGYGEVRPLSGTGQLFTVGLIVAGVGSVGYLVTGLVQLAAAGLWTEKMRGRAMQRTIDAAKDHYIVCGYGRVGEQVAYDLDRQDRTCVVVESDTKRSEAADAAVLFITGDATEDNVLKTAGVERAKGLVAATGDDATNLLITLTAHTLNRHLAIVARANHPGSEPKLRRGGAAHVISPYTISGRRIATQLLYPSITEFLDVVIHSGDVELWLAEVTVHEGSTVEGETVASSQIRERTGTNVLAFRPRDQEAIRALPATDRPLRRGDVLIAMGTREQLEQLSHLAGEDRSGRKM